MSNKARKRVVSYLYDDGYLDDRYFEDEGLSADEYEEGVNEMKDDRREKTQKLVGSIVADVTIIVACVAAVMVACSAAYYCTKGTVGFFKAIGHAGSSLLKR